MITITNEWLQEKTACQEGVDWFNAQKETDGVAVVKKLVAADKLNWANWLIVRIMSYKHYVSYAVFSAEQVIDIYEKKHPNDKYPRQAIEAAKKCIDNPTDENKKVAAATYAADYAAAYAAVAAYAADYAAAYAAVAAVAAAAYDAYAAAAYAAAYADTAAAYAAAATAYAAAATAAHDAYADAYADAAAAMKTKILEYGIKLLEVKNDS